ncbi:MAG: arylesterase [Candidatus Hydrogenedentes bacterium]|nr:arylesterase [Candidatus Hydrogenedentota bacterium]
MRYPSRCARLFATIGVCACAMLTGCGSDFDAVANLNSTGSRIVCLGDSITKGYGATPGNDYPSILSSLLGIPVINAGVNGDTTAGALARLRRDVLDQDPWLVIIELSGNDLVRRIPKIETERNLNQIVKRCIDRGAMVVLVHCKFGILLSDPYLETHQTIAETQGTLLVEDALRGIFGNPARSVDHIHPNDEGYALLAERVFAVVGPLLRESAKSR